MYFCLFVCLYVPTYIRTHTYTHTCDVDSLECVATDLLAADDVSN